MARPDSSIKPAGPAKPRRNGAPHVVVRGGRRPKSDAIKWTWGSSAVEQVDDTTVELDEAIEADVWRLSIDMPGCYVSFQIDGKKQLAELVEFLGRADQPHSLGQIGELGFGCPETSWVWDDETPGRLFIWLNRADPSSMRTTLNPQQVNCIRSALTEAAK